MSVITRKFFSGGSGRAGVVFGAGVGVGAGLFGALVTWIGETVGPLVVAGVVWVVASAPIATSDAPLNPHNRKSGSQTILAILVKMELKIFNSRALGMIFVPD